MFKQNDYVVYKRDVCMVKEIRKNKINNSDYYILVPIDDDSLLIDVPVDNRLGYLKSIISKEEALKLINNISNISPIDNLDDKYIEKIYKELLYNGGHENLIKIIKSTYLRNNSRIKKNKKISEKDEMYFNLAEKFLYNELAVSLSMDSIMVKEYIISKFNS